MNSNQADIKAVLDRLLAMSLQIPFTSRVLQTPIPFLTVLKEISPTRLTHGVLKPSFCIVLQGSKKLAFGKGSLEYGVGDFMAASVEMPVNGQVTEAAADLPYVALRIELTPGEVSSVALEAGLDIPQEKGLHTGVFTGNPGLEVYEAFERLLRLTFDARAARYLAPAIKKEIIYRLLEGEAGAHFYHSMLLHREAAGIAKVIDWITVHFDDSITIDELADLGSMSVSNLHHKFKEVTAMAPLQYQKQLRLQEARRLMLDGGRNVTEAALRVGYQSSTQFIREYKRLFGVSPLRDIKTIREG
jgi:AraC-like DNA-binding protein